MLILSSYRICLNFLKFFIVTGFSSTLADTSNTSRFIQTSSVRFRPVLVCPTSDCSGSDLVTGTLCNFSVHFEFRELFFETLWAINVLHDSIFLTSVYGCLSTFPWVLVHFRHKYTYMLQFFYHSKTHVALCWNEISDWEYNRTNIYLTHTPCSQE